MNALQLKINQLLKEKNSINISEFMEEVIPFYYANNIAIGKNGDFITAPQISQLFGEIIALWIISHCIDNKIEAFNLIELGPGHGTLMHDILRTLKSFSGAYNSLKNIYLVEGSPKFVELQSQLLLPLHSNIFWNPGLDDILFDLNKNKKCANILIANEFFDCLPIRQFIKTKKELCEIVVVKNKDSKTGNISEDKLSNNKLDDNIELKFSLKPTDFVPKINLNLNEIYEQNTNYKKYVTIISNIVKAHPSSKALIIDYGYVDRPIKSTLQALYRHKYYNPLENIGEADLTALVNFSELSELFENEGMNTKLNLQGNFLYKYGIAARCHDLRDRVGVDLSDQMERLTSKDQMGALFKVLEVF